MQMKLELVPVPVADVDRAKTFYTETLGFALDVDVTPADGVRVVQLTPPGSACSIVIGTRTAGDLRHDARHGQGPAPRGRRHRRGA